MSVINKKQPSALEIENMDLRVEISNIKSSTSYQLAQLITQSFSSHLGLLRLPFKIFRFWLEIRNARKIRISVPKIFSKSDSLKCLERIQIDNKIVETEQYLSDGISVIIPCYKGELYIERCLASLKLQSLPTSLYEVIIVINGEPDESKNLIEQFCDANSDIDISLYSLDKANSSNARNYAIEKVTKSYCLNLDVDDEISPNYLSNMYKSADKYTLVFSNLREVRFEEITQSPYSKKARELEKVSELSYWDVASLATINACKLVPSIYLKLLQYHEELKSGDDVVFFSELIAKFRPQIKLCEDYENTYYLRHVVESSQGRKERSFDFDIIQRLKVIERIDNILNKERNKLTLHLLESKIIAQANIMIRYLQEHIDEYEKFVLAYLGFNIQFELCSYVADKLSTTLVVSYCFSPFADTSATVMAKRIAAQELPVDVIFNDMKRVRQKDQKLNDLSSHYVGKSYKVDSPTSFSNWAAIEKFCHLALKQSTFWQSIGTNYEKLYSRAMWPASHFAAALIKITNPKILWIAEFSDPLYLDINGKPRNGEIERSWLEKVGFLAMLRKEGYSIPKSNKLFLWCEYLAYTFADKLVFTNNSQRRYMLSYIKDPRIVELVEHKSTINKHPQPKSRNYSLYKSQYTLDNSKVNLAYFGTFYVTRGMNELFEAVRRISGEERERLEIHLFTDKKTRSIVEKSFTDIVDVLRINDFVPYFEFLYLCDRFDCLVVRDAETKGNKKFNPYLPSKLSDYFGSKAHIWSIYEPESEMEKIIKKTDRITFSSMLFDYEAATLELKRIILDKRISEEDKI